MNQDELVTYTQINYTLKRVCDICEHCDFSEKSSWGMCNIPSIKNQPISIHRAGNCNNWTLSQSADLGDFEKHLQVDGKDERAVKSMKKGLPSR